jgi:hypothetical protein
MITKLAKFILLTQYLELQNEKKKKTGKQKLGWK